MTSEQGGVDLDLLTINTIRTLTIDAVEKAKKLAAEAA